MPVITDNPQWSILEFLYGFVYHEFESRALDMWFRRNIISSKEESKKSHFNQAYDQLVSNNDKNKAAETLSFQRNFKHVNKGVVDQ